MKRQLSVARMPLQLIESEVKSEYPSLHRKFSFLKVRHDENDMAFTNGPSTERFVPSTRVTESLQSKRQTSVSSESPRKKKKKLSAAATSVLQVGARHVVQLNLSMSKEWLLAHTEDPYPTPDEKKQLQELTGLTKVQIRNWFTNVRKRHLTPVS